MNPFQKEVFIRLSDDGSAFTCRIQYGKFYSETTEFAIGERILPAAAEEATFVLLNKRSAREHHDGWTA